MVTFIFIDALPDDADPWGFELGDVTKEPSVWQVVVQTLGRCSSQTFGSNTFSQSTDIVQKLMIKKS